MFGSPRSGSCTLSTTLRRAAWRSALSVFGNYCLGGYVPPHKMQAFVDLLTRHRRELILAWHEGLEDTGDIDRLAGMADFIKILEPATYALRQGYGFIEAAEIYSGILGWMN